MNITVKEEKEVDVKTLEVQAHVRYWEDSEINGVADDNGDLTPCRQGELWCPIIDIDSGIILNWKKGTTAYIHFKVVDEGSYYLRDKDGNPILSIENDYVPQCMCPKDNGYGDYIIMDIDENGKIKDWNPDFEDFENE